MHKTVLNHRKSSASSITSNQSFSRSASSWSDTFKLGARVRFGNLSAGNLGILWVSSFLAVFWIGRRKKCEGGGRKQAKRSGAGPAKVFSLTQTAPKTNGRKDGAHGCLWQASTATTAAVEAAPKPGEAREITPWIHNPNRMARITFNEVR